MSDPLTDPREIRKLLQRVGYYGERIDGAPRAFTPAMVSVTVSHVFRVGEIQGYSGEDTMTLLAYHALLRLETTLDMLVNRELVKDTPK